MNLFAMVKAGTTLLGVDPDVRFFEFGTAPQLEITPYATWQLLSGTPFNYLAGAPSTDRLKVQIDVWASSPQEARAVAHAVRRAIDSQVQVTYLQSSWDEESLLFRSIMHVTYSEEI